MAITKEQVLEQLRRVVDPQLHRDIVTLGWVRNVAYCDGLATVEVRIPRQAAGGRESLRATADAAIRQLGEEIKAVRVDVSVEVGAAQSGAAAKPQAAQGASGESPQVQARANNPLPGVKHIIAVGAGKGGVGKSTVSVNLAIGLARQGAFVGLMDGDIYGPSLPTMLGLEDLQPKVKDGNTLVPFQVHGIQAMTIGALVEDEKPLIWRGPMAHGAFRQLATQTAWGQLDYLIIDLPPGTGDVPLTMAQLLPLTGAVVVCTPQKVAQDDAKRAVRMFQQLGIEVLGVVENMSYFIGDDGKEYDIFGKGGAEMMAHTLGVPFLGSVPISTSLRHHSDAGNPSANFEEDSQLTRDLEALARKVTAQVRVVTMSEQYAGPTLTIR